jgi:hypothetical protein
MHVRALYLGSNRVHYTAQNAAPQTYAAFHVAFDGGRGGVMLNTPDRVAANRAM